MTPPIDPRLATDAERRQQIALFRYGVIAELVQLPPQHRGLYKLLADKAAREYDIPFSLRRRVAAETMRGWLRDYRRGGFDALMPKVRSDVGDARRIPPAVVDLLCETKDATPALSIPLLIKKVREERPDLCTDELELPLSTVHRLLSRRGLMVRNKDDATSKDRRRFEFDAAGELWMSDVMYGPKIRAGGRLRRTYLIAFLDDATRVIPHAAFTFSEGTVAFLPVLEKAVRKRGVPKRLYVDNGAAFRSRHLALVCAKLGIALIHARPYSPQGKGKMERWFRTTRMQLMPMLEPAAPLTLEAMNRALSAWVEGEYHHAPASRPRQGDARRPLGAPQRRREDARRRRRPLLPLGTEAQGRARPHRHPRRRRLRGRRRPRRPHRHASLRPVARARATHRRGLARRQAHRDRAPPRRPRQLLREAPLRHARPRDRRQGRRRAGGLGDARPRRRAGR